MSRLAALRVLIAVAAVSAIAACASPTAPTTSRSLKAPSLNHDGFGPDSSCRAGWVQGDAFACRP
jgi:hypothetical protein